MDTFRDITDPALKSDKRRVYISYILRILGAASAVTLAAMLGPAPVIGMGKKLLKFNADERRKLAQSLKRLERRGMVRRQKRDDGNEYLLLTQAGEHLFLQEKKRTLAIKRPEKWDKVWRMVLFDIVEDKKTVRDAIRRHLRNLGFYRLQKSVFVTPYPCEEEIRFLQKFYESKSEIILIHAVSLGEKENTARRHFQL